MIGEVIKIYDVLNELCETVKSGGEFLLDEIEGAKADIYEEEKLVVSALDTILAVMRHDMQKYEEEEMQKALILADYRKNKQKTGGTPPKTAQNGSNLAQKVPIIGRADCTF